ncbi:MAG: hypothetical protein DDT23_00936 [candidate division WS2 bacterium]|nr:hypothetical protein [Candidatus Lithacetigena glycinireducens]
MAHREEAERRLCSEWMAEHYFNIPYYLNFPLGPRYVSPARGDIDRSWRRKVDALAVKDREIHLLEFKIWQPLDGIDKLPVYKLLVPHTPELEAYRTYPIRMFLITPRPTSAIRFETRLLGIELITVSGGWLDEKVRRIEWLWTKEGREEMERRREIRKWLGV